jgi:hypothetical protein
MTKQVSASEPLFPLSANECGYLGATLIDIPDVKRARLFKHSIFACRNVTYTSALTQSRHLDYKMNEVLQIKPVSMTLNREADGTTFSTPGWATQHLVAKFGSFDKPVLLEELLGKSESKFVESTLTCESVTKISSIYTVTFQIREAHLATHAIEVDFLSHNNGIVLNVLSRDIK